MYVVGKEGVAVLPVYTVKIYGEEEWYRSIHS
jgi:hypothetical protein